MGSNQWGKIKKAKRYIKVEGGFDNGYSYDEEDHPMTQDK